MSGQTSPSTICDYLNTNMPPTIQVLTNDPIYPPRFRPYADASNVVGTSTVRTLCKPMTSNPLFVSTAPNNSVPQPIME